MLRELDVNGKTYKIEITRDSIRAYERAGFMLSEISEKPTLSTDGLIYAALWKHHTISVKNISAVTDEICDEYGTENILKFLTEEFMRVFTSGGGAKPLPWTKEAQAQK